MQVQLDVAVDGKAVGLPHYAENTASPSATLTPAPGTETSPSGPSTTSPGPATNNAAPVGLAIGGGFVLALLLVAGALWWKRRVGRS